MKKEFIITKDGSTTIKVQELDETYHSIHGAVQEAQHVFIKEGWEKMTNKNLDILEIGFGTGLNAILTLKAACSNNKQVNYTGIEYFPLSMEEILQLAYDELPIIQPVYKDFLQMHQVEWKKMHRINENFNLLKIQQRIETYHPKKEAFDLLYFDAFSPSKQPKLWEKPIFRSLFNATKVGGRLVTYSAKGQVRRDLQSVGYTVNRVPGPPGKREMLVALK